MSPHVTPCLDNINIATMLHGLIFGHRKNKNYCFDFLFNSIATRNQNKLNLKEKEKCDQNNSSWLLCVCVMKKVQRSSVTYI